DEKILTDAGLKHDGAALLDLFRKRTGNDDDLEKVTKLVPPLGDEKFAVRWKAADELKALKAGVALVGQLRRVGLTHPDEEVKDQCRVLIARWEKTSPPALVAAAARLLRERAPAAGRDKRDAQEMSGRVGRLVEGRRAQVRTGQGRGRSISVQRQPAPARDDPSVPHRHEPVGDQQPHSYDGSPVHLPGKPGV